MSLELFHEVPARAIETLFDAQNQPLFKIADLGKYLGIRNIKDNFKEFSSHHARPRPEITTSSSSSQDHQQAIEEKDATITLLNDDLKNRNMIM